MNEIKKNSQLTLQIENLAFGGKGIARVNDFVVFVENALPGDQVQAKVYKVKKSYAEAYRTEILSRSELRVDPPCKHFGVCGGCKWQDLNYLSQLEFKRQHVIESLKHIGGITEGNVLPTLPSPDIYFYRNKIEFSFSPNRWIVEGEPTGPGVDLALGFHVPERFDKVLPVENCHLLSEVGNQILNFTRVFSLKSKLPAYDLRTHEGYWRFLVIREGKNTGERMVNLVTARYEPDLIHSFAVQLVEKIPGITSVVNNVTDNRGGVAFGEKEYLLYGTDRIHEKLNDFLFEISANSFFQTNSRQAEKLFQQVVDFAGLTGQEVVLDLYSGTGAIALSVSKYAREVIGFEMIEASVKNAVRNCELNGITNCRFIQDDLRNVARKKDLGISFPDVLITDPPRDGMHVDVVESILTILPKTLIYVSCNPATLARDLKLLMGKYTIKRVQPVDMFPHTYHIEAVAQLMLTNQ